MRIISRLLRSFTGGGRRRSRIPAGVGARRGRSGGGIGSMIRRFLR